MVWREKRALASYHEFDLANSLCEVKLDVNLLQLIKLSPGARKEFKKILRTGYIVEPLGIARVGDDWFEHAEMHCPRVAAYVDEILVDHAIVDTGSSVNIMSSELIA